MRYRTVPQGEEPARQACERWTPDCGVAGKWRDMIERELSAADAALHEGISKLSLHIRGGAAKYSAAPPCGRFAPRR